MSLQYSCITASEGELGKIVMRDFMPPYRTGYLRVGPDKVVVPEYFLNFSDAIRNLDVRQDDVWVISHPKTGTTWVQEMAWCIANDLDFERAKQNLQERFPFLEGSSLADLRRILPSNPDIVAPIANDSVQYVTDQKSPRFIKTHLHWSMLPQQIQDGTKTPKIIYICRNAKDTCVSYFHHCKLLEGYRGSFEDFCKLFIGESVCFAPFWSHVLRFWERQNQSNILFLKFEDMKKDLPSVIQKTANFLGKTLNEQQVADLADHLSFENMKNNKSVNYEHVVEWCSQFNSQKVEGQFMRSGTVGESKEKMSTEIMQKFDAWTKENLQGTGLEL